MVWSLIFCGNYYFYSYFRFFDFLIVGGGVVLAFGKVIKKENISFLIIQRSRESFKSFYFFVRWSIGVFLSYGFFQRFFRLIFCFGIFFFFQTFLLFLWGVVCVLCPLLSSFLPPRSRYHHLLFFGQFFLLTFCCG